MRPRGTPPVISYDEVPCPVTGLDGPFHVFRGHKDKRGYGRVSNRSGTALVHKYVWELANGPVPKGLELDHQCMIKSCCNEKHLRAVTHQVNATENVSGSHWQINIAKTHCPQGHEYTAINTRLRPGNGRGCKQCGREQKQRKKKFQRRCVRLLKASTV